jgi:hypothetical protein
LKDKNKDTKKKAEKPAWMSKKPKRKSPQAQVLEQQRLALVQLRDRRQVRWALARPQTIKM